MKDELKKVYLAAVIGLGILGAIFLFGWALATFPLFATICKYIAFSAIILIIAIMIGGVFVWDDGSNNNRGV